MESDDGVDNLTAICTVRLKGNGIVLNTAHEEYEKIDFTIVKEKMRTPVIIDGRNIWSRKELESSVFHTGA